MGRNDEVKHTISKAADIRAKKVAEDEEKVLFESFVAMIFFYIVFNILDEEGTRRKRIKGSRATAVTNEIQWSHSEYYRFLNNSIVLLHYFFPLGELYTTTNISTCSPRSSFMRAQLVDKDVEIIYLKDQVCIISILWLNSHHRI